MVEEFKLHAREKKFVVRDFTYNEEELAAGKNEITKLVTDKKKQFGPLVRWLKVNFSETFCAWIHVKALRVFVESVLRSVEKQNYFPLSLNCLNLCSFLVTDCQSISKLFYCILTRKVPRDWETYSINSTVIWTVPLKLHRAPLMWVKNVQSNEGTGIINIFRFIFNINRMSIFPVLVSGNRNTSHMSTTNWALTWWSKKQFKQKTNNNNNNKILKQIHNY